MLNVRSHLVAILLVATTVFAQKPTMEGVIAGPAVAKLGNVAEVTVPPGYIFVEGKVLREYLKRAGEPVSDKLLGALHPTNADWSVHFTFMDIGFVKDDDKDKLNADKLLADIREGTEQANKIREKAGNPTVHVIGWEQPPKYNDSSHNLEWAVKGASEGQEILNYDTRLLGRKGVMQVKLIVEPAQFATALPAFNSLLSGYKFETGQTYAEYKPGDKIAKYGLAALVVGGAAVGASKLGLFAWLAVLLKKGFKLVIVALVAIAAAFKKLIAKITGRAPRE